MEKFKQEISAIKQLSGHDHSLPPERQELIKQRLLAAIANEPLPQTQKHFPSWKEKISKIFRLAASVALGLSLAGGTAYAAGNSKPGDVLYPVKLATEKIRLGLSITEQTKAQLQAQFALERLRELKEIKLKNFPVQILDNSNTHSGSTSTAQGEVWLTLPANATGSPLLNKRQNQLQVNTQAEANLEISAAISSLEKVQSKLQDKGETEAAEKISKKILQLQTGAKSENIIITKNKEKQGENNAATSTPAQAREKNTIKKPETPKLQMQIIDKTGSSSPSGLIKKLPLKKD